MCTKCTFSNNSTTQTRCDMCNAPGPAWLRPTAAVLPSPSLSAQPAPPPMHPIVEQQSLPLPPALRITVRSAVHPRGWLLPFPLSYEGLIASAHEYVAPSVQSAPQSALQLFVNRGRLTAATFHLLRDRDVLDALYFTPPPTAPSPAASVSSDGPSVAPAAAEPLLTSSAPSRKRRAPTADETDGTSHSTQNGIHHDRETQPSPPHSQPYLRPLSPPAAPATDTDMPPLSPDRSFSNVLVFTEASEMKTSRSDGRARLSRSEIAVDDDVDTIEAESKAPHEPHFTAAQVVAVAAAADAQQNQPPQRPQPKSTATQRTPPPPPPRPANTSDTSSSPAFTPARTGSLTPVLRSQPSAAPSSTVPVLAWC